MGSMATSGGYYLACAADYIVAQPTTITVNIGVLMPRYNLAELADKWGVKDSTVKSSGSPYKDAGSMLRAETPEERAYFQTLIDQTYTQFKSVVKSGRGKQIAAAKSTVDEVADGRALIAADAMAKGLVDQIGYLDDATSYAASLKGLTKPTVVKFEERPTLMDMFSSSKFDAGNAKVVNGVNVNVDGNLVKELLTPRMMYLWTGQ
jgi:protease-4